MATTTKAAEGSQSQSQATTSTTPSNKRRHRLDFANLPAIREKELQTLLEYAKFSSAADNTPKPSVWIEAEPGVGKSWLLKEFTKTLQQTDSVVVMQGKFEQRAAASEPFAALREAMEDFVQRYLVQHLEFRNDWAEGLQKDQRTFGAFPLLWDIVPEIRPAFDEEVHHKMQQQTAGNTTCNNTQQQAKNPFGDFNSREYRFERFRVAFRNMIRFTCRLLQAHEKTLVMILDDFHWMDPDSMLIVKSLLQDVKKPGNFFLLAATRPREMFPNVLDLYTALVSAPTTTPTITNHIKERLSLRSASGPRRSSSLSVERKAATVPDKSKISVTSETCSSIAEGAIAATTESTHNKSQSSSSSMMRPIRQSKVPAVRIMELTRLSSSQILSILESLLLETTTATRNNANGQRQNDVARLAKIVELKTCGNFFVVMQFLRMLERTGHIGFDDAEKRWIFDTERIRKVAWNSEDVTDTVSATLEAGSKNVRSALMAAAAFGVSRFDVSIIVHAIQAINGENFIGSTSATEPGDWEDPVFVTRMGTALTAQLQEAVGNGFIYEISPGSFRFAHDRIRESAYELLQRDGVREEVHLKIGRQMRLWMDMQEELGMSQSRLSKESLLLHATKQLNAGSNAIFDTWELIDLADLNFQSAELAAGKTSFLSAVDYLNEGIRHLGGLKGWKDQYERMLHTSIALARMQYSCGLLDDSWSTCDGVIEHSKCVEDVTQIYRTRVLCLLQNEMVGDALELVIDVLRMMGEPVPKRFVMGRAIREFMQARKFMRNTTDEELFNMPILHDKLMEVQLDFLMYLGEIAFLLNRTDYVVFVTFRYITLIAQRGMYPRSFFGLCMWACFYKAQMDDFDAAFRDGILSQKLARNQKQTFPGLVARTDGLFCFFVAPLQKAFCDSLELHNDAFQRMWDCGFMDAALYDADSLLLNHFVSGTSVPEIAKFCDACSEACDDYQQTTHWYVIAPQHQAMLNLLGKSNNPVLLSGTIMDLESCRSEWKQSSNTRAMLNSQFWSIILAFHFRDLDRAKAEIKSMSKGILKSGPFFDVLFYASLVYFQIHKSNGKRKYRRKAIGTMKILKSCSAKGAINCVYMSQLLEAEWEASKGHLDTAVALFDIGIQSAQRLKLIHHEALGNELAACMLVENEQTARAAVYLSKAIQLYKEWGAVAIVEDLQSRCGAAANVTEAAVR